MILIDGMRDSGVFFLILGLQQLPTGKEGIVWIIGYMYTNTSSLSLLVMFVQPFGFLYIGFILMHAGLASTAPVSYRMVIKRCLSLTMIVNNTGDYDMGK